MGMMTPEQMPQEMPEQMPQQAPAGMMSGMQQQPQGGNPTTSHGNYNGTVMVEGQPIEVVKGVAEVDGMPYFVSDDGKLVLDAKARLAGHIENGVFVVVDEAYARKMKEMGYV